MIVVEASAALALALVVTALVFSLFDELAEKRKRTRGTGS